MNYLTNEKMKIRAIYILTAILLLTAGISQSYGQVNDQGDTTKRATVDIYKEFDDNSFAEATKKIKDSSLIAQHLIGVKVGYNMTNVSFSQDIEHKSINSPKNFGIYYTYYHSLWKNMPYFGIQTGLEYSEIGYTAINETETANIEIEERYQTIQMPLLSQFRIDFWKMRVMINLGPYGYYITSTDMEGGIPETTNKFGVGIMGGGGIALVLKPIELHLECNYKYALSHYYDPEIYSEDHWLYTHSNQMIFSFGVFYRLGGGKAYRK